jgi:hypothetical protein
MDFLSLDPALVIHPTDRLTQSFIGFDFTDPCDSGLPRLVIVAARRPDPGPFAGAHGCTGLEQEGCQGDEIMQTPDMVEEK